MQRTTIHNISAWILAIALPLSTTGCEPTPDREPEEIVENPTVTITARDLQFEAPDEIPSGWITFDFDNASGLTHFAVFERLPEGIGVEEQQEQVAPVFQQAMDLLNAGKVDSGMAKFGELPEWFSEIEFTGGPGLLAPGKSGKTTVHLEPGTYIMECYVKTGGIFHSYNPLPDVYGMVRQFTVTDDSSTASAPTPSITLTLSFERGIEVEGALVPGEHTVAVYFEDQTAHENFVGHDVHLARLTPETSVDSLETWMDWSQTTGLETPAPVEFLGGVEEMGAGQTGYFTATLEPGLYAFISEVPNAIDKGMLETFSVPATPEEAP